MLAVETIELTKDYQGGFWRRGSKRALDGLSLRIEAGEIFGLLGPRGAGKTTMLKLLLRLVFPTAGTAHILGRELEDLSVRCRVGYLPENPGFYDHLTPQDLLNYVGELFGMATTARRSQAGQLLEQMRLTDAREVPLREFNREMLQRLGIAQALMNDPDVVFLDEPMSGLDPLGRGEVRDLLLRLKSRGKTVLVATRHLADAETSCDRAAVLHLGRLQGCGELSKILPLDVTTTELVLESPGAELIDGLRPYAESLVCTGDRWRVTISKDTAVGKVLEIVLRLRGKVISLDAVKTSLENYFLVKPPADGEASRDEAVIVPDQRGRGRRGEPRARALAAGNRGNVGLLSVARHTFKESMRQRFLTLLIVFALLLIAASLLLARVSVGIERMTLTNLGLSSISIFGLLMAIFLGAGLLPREIERRTIYLILSKPVSRPAFLTGKVLGLLLTLGVSAAVMTAGLYLALIYQERGLGAQDLGGLGAVYFILLQLTMLVGLAMLFSCLSSATGAAIYTSCLYVVGNFLGELRAWGQGSALFHNLTAGLYYLLPNFRNFNVITRVAHGEKIPGYLFVSNSCYALLCVAILLSAAVLIFEEREL